LRRARECNKFDKETYGGVKIYCCIDHKTEIDYYLCPLDISSKLDVFRYDGHPHSRGWHIGWWPQISRPNMPPSLLAWLPQLMTRTSNLPWNVRVSPSSRVGMATSLSIGRYSSSTFESHGEKWCWVWIYEASRTDSTYCYIMSRYALCLWLKMGLLLLFLLECIILFLL